MLTLRQKSHVDELCLDEELWQDEAEGGYLRGKGEETDLNLNGIVFAWGGDVLNGAWGHSEYLYYCSPGG